MNTQLVFTDTASIRDLQSFLVRAAKIELGAVQLLAVGNVLAATVAVIYPVGLFERKIPTILGLRTFGLSEPALLDTTVKQRAILDRIARMKLDEIQDNVDVPALEIPDETVAVSWAGVKPPREDWVKIAEVSSTMLNQAAKAGIDEIAQVIPGELGEARVRKVRGTVWSRTILNPAGGEANLAAGNAFAGFSLGFFEQDSMVDVLSSGNWLRLSTPYGHVIQRAGMA